ncbi:PqqD family protein [Nocardia donostiensis]|uniref:PqqD family protein n=1 Tax=Nocardia donostiensis TaxID=1538463 RepID=A0A1W0B9N9_9NOCA|nr:PqqD family protein [Nocardia donostiensis]ONM49586.1 hypothetical protein B0T46_07005 [Nocardia donostiensis]OQS19207.1 hypothetical protein B0T44_15295 [Nocardia donostiensis]
MMMYSRNRIVLDQQDVRLFSYRSVAEAVDSGIEFEGHEAAVLLSANGQLYELNLVGALLWEALDEEKTAADLALLLEQAFDADGVAAHADVNTYLADMTSKGLITVDEDHRSI